MVYPFNEIYSILILSFCVKLANDIILELYTSCIHDFSLSGAYDNKPLGYSKKILLVLFSSQSYFRASACLN